MTRQEFTTELASLNEDAAKEGQETLEPFITMFDLTNAFIALRDHRELDDGLFNEEDKPSDECLLQIFSFITIP